MRRLLDRLHSIWVFMWSEKFGRDRPLPPLPPAYDGDSPMTVIAAQAAQRWDEVEAKIRMYRAEAEIVRRRAQRELASKQGDA